MDLTWLATWALARGVKEEVSHLPFSLNTTNVKTLKMKIQEILINTKH